MSTLFMVRHGQASFGQMNYDSLSELGMRQCRLLGKYWTRWGLGLDAVYTGALERQRQSMAMVGEVYKQAGLDFPEAVEIPGFNEYDAQSILTGSMPEVLAAHPEIAGILKELAPRGEADLKNDKKAFQRVFARVMDLWVDGKLEASGMETWEEFSDRVNSAIGKVIQDTGSGRTAAVFSSGGPVSIAVQKALHVPDKPALELGWMIKNGSVSEFRFSRGRFSMVSFNTAAHLAEPGLVSHR